MEGVPAFIGAPLDLGATNRVADYARALRRAATSAHVTAAWVPPPNLHVTLRNLGSVDPGLLGPVGDIVAEVARRFTPCRVALGALAALPDPARPQRLALGFARGSEALSALRSALDERLDALGIPAPPGDFIPRVTLGVVRDFPVSEQPVKLPPSSVAGLDANVAELCLWRSDLTRPGVEHHALRRAALNPRAAAADERGGQNMSERDR